MNELSKLSNHLILEAAKSVNTSIPATVISFDAETGLAQCQIMIKSIDREGEEHAYPPVLEVHVVQYGDKDFFIETQIEPQTEGILFFSQRCFDDWRETGSLSGQSIIRFHDVSDAYFLAGMRSLPNKIQNHSNNGIKIRNKDDTTSIWIKKDGSIHHQSKDFKIQIEPEGSNQGVKLEDANKNSHIWLKGDNTASITINELQLNGTLTHNGDTMQTGSLNVSDDIVSKTMTAQEKMASPSILANTKELAGHTHGAGSLPTGLTAPSGGGPVTGSTGENK